MTGVFIKRGYLDTETHMKGRAGKAAQRIHGHLQTKEKEVGQILPSQPLEGTNAANALIVDSQPPEP